MNADKIEREVEENRARVESTLDALKERMSVNQVVDDLANFVRVEDLRGVMHSAGRQVRDNPVALGLIGVGLAWLAFGGSSSRSRHVSAYDREEYYRSDYGPAGRSYEPYGGGASYRSDRGEGVVSRVKHAVSDAADSVSRAAHSATDKVAETFGDARDRAGSLRDDVYDRAGRMREDAYDRAGHWRDDLGERSSHLRDRAGHLRDRASHGAHQMRDSMSHGMEQQPLLVGAAAVALGAVIGAALPRTRTEDEWMGRTSDELWDEAKASSWELRERAMKAARGTYDATIAAARDEGLVPEKGETLASKVGRVADAAASEAKAQVEPVLHGKDEDKSSTGMSSAGAGSTGSTDSTTKGPGTSGPKVAGSGF
ncbi:DUF3618 domain-containing protein [Cereibacter sphaeroides]|uniref:DUF3618 domain-containing protein n=1 Tax=Cereibacter sphaeroides TaxID=1063 RepID=UPI000191C584|nr:DUF3618 domain-containing protein [Cereibacter sphaeroides]ACM00556.1 Hypothetical Protein RSKD131_0696 [Cereibacter sphaeroides KD131]